MKSSSALKTQILVSETIQLKAHEGGFFYQNKGVVDVI